MGKGTATGDRRWLHQGRVIRTQAHGVGHIRIADGNATLHRRLQDVLGHGTPPAIGTTGQGPRDCGPFDQEDRDRIMTPAGSKTVVPGLFPGSAVGAPPIQ
jgi:hypothetical protein